MKKKLKKLKERVEYLLNASNRHEAVLQEMRAELDMILQKSNTSQSNNLEVGNDSNVVSKLTRDQLLDLFNTTSKLLTHRSGIVLNVIDSDDFKELADKILESQVEKICK